MIQKFADFLVYSVLKLNPETRIGESINFFIYDSIKILLLLFFMIAIIGFFRTYMPQEKVKKWVSGKGILGNLIAAIFGSVTPFCSCSSIPIFFGFLEAGIPLGITFSFLITSPLINEYLVVLMLGFFGWKITVLYVLSGILIGVVSGAILGKMKLERYIVKDLVSKGPASCGCKTYNTIKQRVIFGINEAVSIVKKVWIWVLVGVGIGSVIHNYIPQETIHSIISKTGIFSVPIAAILGVPMYGNCAAIVPIAVVLFRKGIPLGTALTFMMATVALSFPEAVILKRTMKLKLVIIFFTVTTLAIIITGYIFNFLQYIM
ncbi:MAG: permease [Candidatus Omnitrophota bacterium]